MNRLDRRLRARALLDAGLIQAEVARQLGVSRQSVGRWARQTMEELTTVKRRPGRGSALKASQWRCLADRLKTPPAKWLGDRADARWTAKKFQALLRREPVARRYSLSQAWRIMRQAQGRPVRPLFPPR